MKYISTANIHIQWKYIHIAIILMYLQQGISYTLVNSINLNSNFVTFH